MENKCQIVIFFIFEMFVVSHMLPEGGELSSLREQLVEEKISDPTPSWLNIFCVPTWFTNEGSQIQQFLPCNKYLILFLVLYVEENKNDLNLHFVYLLFH